MISQVTFWVAHDETTDALQDFIETTEREYASGDITMLESDFIVDVRDPALDEEGDRANDAFFDRAFKP